MTRHRHLALASAAAGVAAVLLATPASADPVVDLPGTVVEQWSDSGEQVFLDGDPEFCGDLGFDVVNGFDVRGTFVGTVRGDGLWSFGSRFHGSEWWTNPDTGHVFLREFAGTDRDQEVVDDGDGTLAIQVQATGPSRYSLDGEKLFIDTGMLRFSLLVDHGGTPGDPGDDGEAEFLGVDFLSGLRQTEGRDFCQDIADFLG